MKKLIYILSLALACTACNFLETDTYDYLKQENIYRNETDCMAGLTGVYDALASFGC